MESVVGIRLQSHVWQILYLQQSGIENSDDGLM